MATINTEFDPDSVPAWARNSREIIWYARRNLGFRANVCGAEHADYQETLRREAERAWNAEFNGGPNRSSR